MNREKLLQTIITKPRKREAGNAIAMVFMAIGMAGVVVYGLNNIMRGPAMTAAETSRRTIAENNLVATTRLAITAAARQQSNNGDCDQDGFVEPMPFRAVVAPTPFPAGGGLLPMTVGASLSDPWGTQYGYCVWDPGTVRKSDAYTGCGGAGANRLDGAKRDDQPAIAVISAGKNGTFETSCSAFVDTTPADEKPDTPLVVKPAGSDDIVLSYTYAEANGIGGGLWKISQDPMKPDTAEIGMNIKSSSAQGASFGGKVELKNKGLVLPGDPGDDSVTGACDAAKDGQLRRNTGTSPPTIEMCDFGGSAAWVQVSGGSGPPADPVCYFGGYSSVWAGAGPSGMVLSDSGSHIYGTGNFNDLFSTYTTADPANPTSNTIYGSNGGNFDDAVPLATSGNYAYVPSGSNRLTVVDVSTPMSQTVAGFVSNVWLNSASGVAVSGNYVYVTSAGGADRLNVIDVAAPASPVIVGSVTDSWLDGATGVAVSGNYAYIPAFDAGALTVVDVTTPASPSVHSHLNLSWSVNTIAIKGNYAYVGSYYSSEIYVVDISDPANPALVTTFNNAKFQNIFEIRVLGRYLFISAASFSDTPNAGLVIVDIGTPATPTIVGSVQFDSAGSTIIKGHYAYVAGLGLEVFDIGCDPLVGGGTPPSSGPVSGSVKYMTDPLDVGLVSHWKFDEPPITSFTPTPSYVVADSVGTNHGDRQGNNVSVITGQKGNALEFEKNGGEQVVIPGHLGEPQQATIAGWVNLAQYNHLAASGMDVAHIFSVGDYMTLASYYSDESASGPSGLALHYWDGAGWAGFYSKQQIAGTGWHYVVGTFDAVNDRFRIYLDGQMITDAVNGPDIGWTGLGANTVIGRHGNGGNAVFNFSGAVDEFRFYNRTLSPSEVAALTNREFIDAAAPSSLKQLVSANNNANKIAAGDNTTCAIKKDGTLWCWGKDENQQLGNGALMADQPLPVQVSEPTTQVYYLNGIASDLTTGSPAFSNRLALYQEAGLSATGAFSAAQTKTGLGYTLAAEPGVDDGSGLQPYSVTVRTSSPVACIQMAIELNRVNSGGTVQSTAALDSARYLSTTATKFSGRVDLGAFASTDRLMVKYTMTEVCNAAQGTFNLWGELETPLRRHSPWVSVSLGESHGCGVKADGSGWCWGMDQSGSMGNSAFSTGALFPEPHRLSEEWVSLHTSSDNTCGLQKDGAVKCSGLDTYGQIGNGATTGQMDMPSAVTLANWRSISVSDQFACGVDGAGTGYCWGRDNLGRLGNGAIAGNKTSPYEINEPGPWVKISTGAAHACGLKADSSIWCWGYNTAAQLGVILTSSSLESPTLMSKPYGWTDVVAGPYFTCAINVDSKMYCWGDSGEGRLGNSDTTVANYDPWPVNGSEDTVAIALGYHHACSLKNNGAVFCWGEDNYGQLGNGSGATSIQNAPNAVQGFPGTAGWTWNTAATNIMLPGQANVGLNGGYFTDGTSVPGYFGFTSPGRALMRQELDSTQLLVQAGTNGSPGLIFKPSAGQNASYTAISLWNFNETTGTTAASTPATYPATLNGGVVHDSRGGVPGTYGLTFDGLDDFGQVANHANLRPTAITIGVWINPAIMQGTDARIISKSINNHGTYPYNSYGLKINSNGVLTFETSNAGILDSVTGYVQPNRWSYVIASYNPGATSPKKRLYVNGVFVGSSTVSTAVTYDTGATGDLFIGQNGAGAQRYTGMMDDLSLYSRGFNDNEAMALYYAALVSSGRQTPRSMGIDYLTDTLKIAKNPTGTGAMDTLTADITLTAAGNVGIGTSSPATKLDINGAIRIGTDLQCDNNRQGSVRYTGGTPAWTYCNGTAWTAFAGAPIPWKSSKETISAGWSTCGIRSEGTAWCWGIRDSGVIGDGGAFLGSQTTPAKVQTDTGPGAWNDWVKISNGRYTNCGIRVDGSAWCWGWGAYGMLGDGTTSSIQIRPARVQTDTGPGGWNDWIKIVSGNATTCGIRSNGTAWCWGAGDYGQMGNGTTTSAQLRPTQVQNNTGPGAWNDWLQISLAEVGAVCGLRVDGTIWCWGNNGNGSLGNGSTIDSLRPVQVQTDTGPGGWNDWIQLSGTCGIRSNGTAWCWGVGAGGGLGNGGVGDQSRPVQVQTDTGPGGWNDWKVISANGGQRTCGIRVDGSAWCWGAGAVGNGAASSATGRPVLVHTNTGPGSWYDWTNITTDGVGTISCGTRAGGTMWCWGSGSNGERGDGTTTATATRPKAVIDP